MKTKFVTIEVLVERYICELARDVGEMSERELIDSSIL